MSSRDPKEEKKAIEAFAADETYNQAVLASCLRSISEAVVSIHYSGYPGREELVSIGIEKALTMLRVPYFDPRKNVRGYLYTGIRNEVGNYLRRESRSISVEPTSECFGSTQTTVLDDLWGVEYKKRQQEIQERLRVCGVIDDRYHETVRGAALYRAIL